VLVSSRELREMVLDFMNPQMGVRRTIVNPPGGLPETRTFELWRCVGPR
jgi:hypothetical protein